MSAKIDNDRDIQDFIPEFAFLRALNALKTQEGIYNYEILDRTHDLYSISPIPNIRKIDLDTSKTVTLKCLGGIG